MMTTANDGGNVVALRTHARRYKKPLAQRVVLACEAGERKRARQFWTRDKIAQGLKVCGGNVSQAAEYLSQRYNRPIGRRVIFDALKRDAALRDIRLQAEAQLYDICRIGLEQRARAGNERAQRILFSRLVAKHGGCSMCVCTPEIRTPYCGKPGCQWPKSKPGFVPATPGEGVMTETAKSTVPIMVDDPRTIPDAPHYAIIWGAAVPVPGAGPAPELTRALSIEMFPDRKTWEAAVDAAYRGARPFKAVLITPHKVSLTVQQAAPATRA